MCLILFAVQPDARHRLVVAANRDEQYARPTASAAWWANDTGVLAGRDLQAGGTWLGVTRNGRFAAVTNFREDPPDPLPPRSRGELTAAFLTGRQSPAQYLESVQPYADEYRGFNLVVSDGRQCCYFSNRSEGIRILAPGYYGLSNQLLDCDWPKVGEGRSHLQRLAGAEYPVNDLFELLFCRGSDVPFSQRFIISETYGTSASTAVKIMASGEIEFEERNFAAGGEPGPINRYEFRVDATDC